MVQCPLKLQKLLRQARACLKDNRRMHCFAQTDSHSMCQPVLLPIVRDGGDLHDMCRQHHVIGICEMAERAATSQ
jgi:hypothetical protein